MKRKPKLKKYPDGGNVKSKDIPTTQDSTNLYNAQIALNKFYENEKKLGRIEEKPKLADNILVKPIDLNNDNLRVYRKLIQDRVDDVQPFDSEYKNFYNLSPEQVKKLEYQGLGYAKSGNNHIAYYRDLITPMQNMQSPMALYDDRIVPDGTKFYSPTVPSNPNEGVHVYPGGNVEVYYYNPERIKPYNLLTDKEKLQRNKSKEVVKPKPIVVQQNTQPQNTNYPSGPKPTGTKLGTGTNVSTVQPTVVKDGRVITTVTQDKKQKDMSPVVKQLPQNVKYKTGYGNTNFYWIKEGNKVSQLNTPEEYLKYDYPEVDQKSINPSWSKHFKNGGMLPKYSPGGATPYNAALDATKDYNAGDPNRSSNAGMSNANYIQAGVSGVKAAATIANTANNSELTDAQKKQQYAQATNQVVDTVGSMMFPWYGPAKKGEAMAKSIIGNHPDDPTNRALNALATPQHEQMIDDAIKGNYVDAVGDIAGAGFYAPIKAYFNKDTMYKHGGKHKPKINFINPQPGNMMYGTEQYPDGGKKKVDRNTQDVYSKWRNEFIKTHPDMNGRDLMEYYNKYVTPKLGIYDYSPTNPKRDTIYIDTNLSYMDNLINSSGDSTLIYKYNDRKNKDPYFKNMFEKKDSNEIINPNHFPDGGLYNPNNALSDINFQDWYSKNTPEGKRGIPFNIKNLDYDYYSYYKNEGAIPNIKGSHFTDKYKLPNHKTFSNESLYSTPENPGGFWNGEKYNKNGKFLYPFGGQSNTPNAEVIHAPELGGYFRKKKI